MSSSFLHGMVVRQGQKASVAPLHLLILLSLSLGALAWGGTLVLGRQGHQFQSYLALLGFYAAASAAFVASRIRGDKLNLFEVPVFITCLFFLHFGLAPMRNFIDPTQLDRNLSADGKDLVLALFYFVLGMIGFWIGCELAQRKPGGQNSSNPGRPSAMLDSGRPDILLFAVVFYAASFATKVYLLQNHLYGIMTSQDKYYANLASMQMLDYVSQFGTFTLIVVAIEAYRHQLNRLWKIFFVVALSSEVIWGMISGMKGSILINFLVVALVSSLIQRRLNLRWLILPALGVILLSPVVSVYRSLVRGSAAQEVTSFGEAQRAGDTALQQATQGSTNLGGLWTAGLNSIVERLDLLTSVAQVLTLGPRANMVKGDVRLWMLPVYPFVPRFFWPSKPIQDESVKFSVALGGSWNSSTAITYPGDLYLQYGWLGIPIGMLIFGLICQWVTNTVSGPLERQALFVYTCIFVLGFSFEGTSFGMWASFLRLLVIVYPLSWVIYGPRMLTRRAPSSNAALTRQL